MKFCEITFVALIIHEREITFFFFDWRLENPQRGDEYFSKHLFKRKFEAITAD